MHISSCVGNIVSRLFLKIECNEGMLLSTRSMRANPKPSGERCYLLHVLRVCRYVCCLHDPRQI